MLWSWLADMGSGTATWFFGTVPAPASPDWLTSISSQLSGTSSTAWAYLANWVPVGPVQMILTVWASAYIIAASVYILRMVISFFTGGGGSVNGG